MHALFVWKFVQSQTLSREKTFGQKMCVQNVDEIDNSKAVNSTFEQKAAHLKCWWNELQLSLFTEKICFQTMIFFKLF